MHVPAGLKEGVREVVERAMGRLGATPCAGRKGVVGGGRQFVSSPLGNFSSSSSSSPPPPSLPPFSAIPPAVATRVLFGGEEEEETPSTATTNDATINTTNDATINTTNDNVDNFTDNINIDNTDTDNTTTIPPSPCGDNFTNDFAEASFTENGGDFTEKKDADEEEGERVMQKRVVLRSLESVSHEERVKYNDLVERANRFLFYFILFYFILFYFILFYFILFYFILFYFILFYFILFYFIYSYLYLYLYT